MHQRIEQIRSELDGALLLNQGIEKPLEKLTADIKVIDGALARLKEFIVIHRFDDPQEEIEFFKTIKPEILGTKQEAGLRYNLAINKPIGTAEVQQKYFKDELRSLQGSLRLNTYHYQYYKNGSTNLDALYFLRGAEPLPVPVAEAPEPDTDFSTPMSYLFSKFIALERTQYHILEEVAFLKYPDLEMPARKAEPTSELKWTGDSINAVELAYGLWLTGQFNNGNASLNQIVRWLEIQLNVNIGIVQRRFSEISRRKRLSITKFIDQMKEGVLKKINDSFE